MTARAREPRPYPLDVLAAKLGIGADDPAYYDRLSKRLGLARSQIIRMRARGLTDRQADEWAIRGGLMPHQVWPRWRDSVLLHGVALINANRVACGGCGRPYDGYDNRGRRICLACRRNAWRRWKATKMHVRRVTCSDVGVHASDRATLRSWD